MFIISKGFATNIQKNNYSCAIATENILQNFQFIIAESEGDFETFKNSAVFHKHVTINNLHYKINDIIVTDMNDIHPKFRSIIFILENNSQDFCFVYEEVNTLCFDKHFGGLKHKYSISTYRRI